MAQPVLSVEALKVSFNGLVVLDGLDLRLDHHELRFLIGPNGAGKTTLLDVITGKTRAGGGKVVFDGKIDLARRQEHDLVRLGIGRKFQTPSVFTSLTVYQNLEVAAGFRNRTAALFRPLGWQQRHRIGQALEQTGLAHRASHPAGVLSHGEKQWLEIGMLMTQDPQLLLLDEPVAGMTRQERERTGELLENISRDRTVLVVEHDMEFVRSFARTVTVLHLGNVLSEGTMDAVQRDPRVIQAYLGRAGVVDGCTASQGRDVDGVAEPRLAPAGAPAA